MSAGKGKRRCGPGPELRRALLADPGGGQLPGKRRTKVGAVAWFRGGLLVVVLPQANLPEWHVEKGRKEVCDVLETRQRFHKLYGK